MLDDADAVGDPLGERPPMHALFHRDEQKSDQKQHNLRHLDIIISTKR